MESFKDIKKLFDFSIPDMINNIMLELNDEIISLNQVEQLAEGIDALNQKISTISANKENDGNVYSHFTINERRIKGLQTNNVDLNFTGAFWNSFKVVQVKNGWEIQADYNIHGENIQDNFDSKFDFTGLTDNNIDYLVNQYVFPELRKRIKAKLNI